MKKVTYILLFFLISAFLYSSKANTKYGIVTSKSGLVLRVQPTAKSRKIIIIPYNVKVIIINESGPRENIYGIDSRWYKVKYKNQIGWVFGGFLKSNDSERDKNKMSNNKLPLAGEYIFRYDQFSPLLILNDNKTFSMTLNVCTGMLEAYGIYEYEKDIVTAEIRNCKQCLGFSGIEGITIIFKRISNNELVVENEIYRYQDGQKFGFCAPNRGDIFKRKF